MIAPSEPAEGSRRLNSQFALWAGIALVLIAFLGFARTFYLKTWFGSPELPIRVHVHGIVMSLWCFLVLTQICLVATRRIDWHRRVGAVGALLAVVVVAIAGYITVVAATNEIRGHTQGDFTALLGFNLVNLAVFSALFTTGLAYRHRPNTHKRLMILAAFSLLPPAVARIELPFTHSDTVQMVGVDLCILALVIADTVRHGRIHPAMAWGALWIVVPLHLTLVAVQSSTWAALASWLLA